MAYKAWLANKSSVELCSQYSEARKAATAKVELSEEGPGRNLEKGWTMISKRRTKCFGRLIAVLTLLDPLILGGSQK